VPSPEMDLKLKFLQRAAVKISASVPNFHRQTFSFSPGLNRCCRLVTPSRGMGQAVFPG